MITNCNCGEKIDCGCTLSFSSHVQDAVSVLDVGDLLGGTCSFDEYVIDWYKDGVFYMTSGKGFDPEIQAFHPFTGSSAIPVPSGVYNPFLRYVILTGGSSKLFPTPKPCQNWCQFSGSLPAITVQSIGCGDTGGSPSTNYDYGFHYLSSQDYSLATRTIRFFLQPEVTHLCFSFKGYNVADRVKAWMNDKVTLLADWILGGDAGWGTDDSMPYHYPSSVEWGVILEFDTGAQEGDFITFEVFPSVISGNTNTEWDLNLKCFLNTDAIPFSVDYDFWNHNMRFWDINTFSFTYNSSLCRFELSFNMLNPAPDLYALDFQDYIYSIETNSQLLYDHATGDLVHYLNYKTTAGYRYQYTPGYGKKNSVAGLYITKANGQYIFEFLDQQEYLDTKTAWNWILASASYMEWVDDPTSVNYYKGFIMEFYLTPSQCGDNETRYQLRAGVNCDVVFDDATMIVTVTMHAMTTGGYPSSSDPCNTVQNDLHSYASSLNYQITSNEFQRTFTKCYDPVIFKSIQSRVISSPSIYSEASFYYMIADKSLPQPLSDTRYYKWRDYYPYCNIYIWQARLEITAERDANGNWISDPLENFKVYYKIDPVTYGSSYPGIVIYEKVNGVVTTALPYTSVW